MEAQIKAMGWNLTPVAVDLISVVLYSAMLPLLVSRFQQKSAVNSLIIGVVYLLFCLSVYIMRRVEPGSGDSFSIDSMAVLGFLGAAFGMFLTYMAVESGGILDNLEIDLESGAASFGLMLVSILWLGLVFLYAGILLIDIQPTISRGTVSAMWLELFSLIGVNLMIILTAAFWETIFIGTEPYDTVTIGGKILIFIVTFAFFLFFFAPPRMLFLTRNPSLGAIASFLLQTGYYVWGSLSRNAW